MILDKKQEKEILQVYDTWLEAYLNGDVETYNYYLDDAYHFIGSTNNEEFLNRKDTTEFFRATADQLAGKCDLRNETRTLEQFGELMFITHVFDAWFLNGSDYSYYGRFRFTNILRKNKEGWRFIYQHYSTPDAKTDQGETVGFEKVNIENQQLREAINRRTFELEQKNRELEMEAALERVRYRAIAMRHSDELSDAAEHLYNEFLKMGVESFSCGYLINDDDKQEWKVYLTNPGEPFFKEFWTVPYTADQHLKERYESWQRKEEFHSTVLEGEENHTHHVVIAKYAPWKAEMLDALPPRLVLNSAHFSMGHLLVITPDRLTAEQEQAMVRFAGVFDLAYRRFNDLKLAEEQVREAQLETALERIRSQVSSMQQSTDLLDIVVNMRKEFVRLGHEAHYFWHMRWHPDKYEKAMTSGDGTRIGMVMELPRRIHGEIKQLAEWEKSDEPTVVFTMDIDATLDYVHKMTIWGDFQRIDPNMPTEEDIRHIGGLTYVMARTSLGEIGYSLPGVVKQVPQTDLDILVRFARAFDLAHKRFEDLKTRERQARETQIELALEKVRSRTISMQHSDELKEASGVLIQQVLALGIPAFSCGYNIFEKDADECTAWMSTPDGGIKPAINIPLTEDPNFIRFAESKKQGEEFYVLEMRGADMERHYQYLSDTIPVFAETFNAIRASGQSLPPTQIHHLVNFTYGNLMFITLEPCPDAHDIFKRFGKVFEQTYTRFLDLQKAEAQAREAQIEAALEKVRGRTMAMHSPGELEEVVAVVAEKLQSLGIILDANGVILCTYFKDSRDVMHWISAPDFSGSGRYLLPYFDHPIFSAAWESRESGIDYFSKSFSVEEKNSFFEYAFEHSDYKHFPEDFKEWVFQNDKHSLSFAWSKNSAILIPSHTGVVPNETDIEILKRFAKVFEQAYIRFMDLQTKEEQAAKILEEKQRLEETLHDLRLTQKQLIQSEKMASLGELTAGIAHEIQNPLNFVNNFSEVSTELLDEMNEEIDNGDLDEVKAIAHDIKLNLQKINHHGQRADAIVKGMLQHSRKSTGEKTPTDINKLADEYLRLAYHGLRAKDKSFNATLDTAFDPMLDKIMVIPQDIGRVLLNLITNAFYAVSEKKKLNGATFEPTVTVSTNQHPEHITIAVKDNGNGIPPAVLNKVFQPFFTTKPTGQGTGLGLSLSYDILKAHGGEIKIDTQENEGSEFTIFLPLTN